MFYCKKQCPSKYRPNVKKLKQRYTLTYSKASSFLLQILFRTAHTQKAKTESKDSHQTMTYIQLSNTDNYKYTALSITL